MKKLFLFFAVTILSFTACTKDLKNIKVENQEMTDMAGAVNYTIPIEEAIEELYSTLDFIESERMFAAPSQSASQGKRREIDKISVIYGNVAVHPQNNSSTADKQTFATTQKDSLLYIIDFKNNAGSAVLAADSRIPDPVLVITEQGSLKDTNNNMYPPEYKQGMYADSELMKGFSLYNAELDDYYVAGRPRILDYCEQYANQCLVEYKPPTDTAPKAYYKLKEFPWQIEEKISPMLTTVWHQDSPFNDAAPELNWHPWQNWKKQSPAGCYPIAMAQVIAYHAPPLTCNGYKMNWDKIKKIWSFDYRDDDKADAYDKAAIAEFLKWLADYSDAKRKPDFTFVYPHKARQTMDFFYHNSKTHCDYDANLVYDMLKQNKPPIMAAISGAVNGHAWVIDGYIHRSRKWESWYIEPPKKPLLRNTTYEHQYLIHCNWGWGGTANGYYAHGIFNTRQGAVEIEDDLKEDNKDRSKYDFNWFFRLLTYDR